MRALQSTFRFGAMVIVIFCVSTGLPETRSANATPVVAVGPKYDAAHVYVAPENVDAFVKVFLGALGGTSTKQVVLTVTPAPSSTSSQPLQTPVGTVSDGHLPYPYGRE